MIGMPEEVKKILEDNMKGTEGTFSINIKFKEDIFDNKDLSEKVIFEIMSGKNYFRLERTKDLKIKFYHSSLALGTRLAIADISKSIHSFEVFFSFTWSIRGINVYVGPKNVENTMLIIGKETKTDKKILLGKNGIFFETHLDVSGVEIIVDGKKELETSAIESWKSNLEAVKVLINSIKKEGDYMLDVVKANFACVVLVTGIETYQKKRIKELELEKIKVDFDKLKEKTKNKITKNKIYDEKISFFQNLDDAKNIWKYAVNIDITKINQSSWQIFKEKMFPHRHNVVHEESIKAIIKFDKNIPLFIVNEIENFKNISEDFIKKLHKKTLEN